MEHCPQHPLYCSWNFFSQQLQDSHGSNSIEQNMASAIHTAETGETVFCASQPQGCQVEMRTPQHQNLCPAVYVFLCKQCKGVWEATPVILPIIKMQNLLLLPLASCRELNSRLMRCLMVCVARSEIKQLFAPCAIGRVKAASFSPDDVHCYQ